MAGTTARRRARALVVIGCIGAFVILAAVTLFIWDQDGVRISVENATQPPVPLAIVEVSVRNDAKRIGDIPPGERRTVRLRPRGESDVTLGFVLEGRTHHVTSGYVEASGGYRADLIIRERGTVLMRECGPVILFCDAPLHGVSE